MAKSSSNARRDFVCVVRTIIGQVTVVCCLRQSNRCAQQLVTPGELSVCPEPKMSATSGCPSRLGEGPGLTFSECSTNVQICSSGPVGDTKVFDSLAVQLDSFQTALRRMSAALDRSTVRSSGHLWYEMLCGAPFTVQSLCWSLALRRSPNCV